MTAAARRARPGRGPCPAVPTARRGRAVAGPGTMPNARSGWRPARQTSSRRSQGGAARWRGLPPTRRSLRRPGSRGPRRGALRPASRLGPETLRRKRFRGGSPGARECRPRVLGRAEPGTAVEMILGGIGADDAARSAAPCPQRPGLGHAAPADGRRIGRGLWSLLHDGGEHRHLRSRQPRRSVPNRAQGVRNRRSPAPPDRAACRPGWAAAAASPHRDRRGCDPSSRDCSFVQRGDDHEAGSGPSAAALPLGAAASSQSAAWSDRRAWSHAPS